jgi:putative tryptophan/tyrosine transport system substrate-binding protein
METTAQYGECRALTIMVGAVTGRRAFVRVLAGFGLLAAFPLVGCGEPLLSGPAGALAPRVGYLQLGSPETRRDEVEAFEAALTNLLETEGVRPVFETRYADSAEQLQSSARELVALSVSVIVAFGTDAVAATTQASSGVIPVVMASSSDPVGSKFVASLESPGGNITGLTSSAPLLTGKRLQLLRDAVPTTARIAFLRSDSGGDDGEETEFLHASRRLGLDSLVMRVIEPSDLPSAFADIKDRQGEAVLTAASAFVSSNRSQIAALSRQYKLPAMYAQRELVVDAHGLMAYGPDYVDMYRRAAVYVYKILNGASPRNLPVEKPPRFKFTVNRQAVIDLGLTLPRSLLVQTDEVI